MKKRIETLLNILNKYSVAEINKIYRDKEVQLEIESFTKHPDVRWSEKLQKKMIQQAKRKKISQGRQDFLTELLKEIKDYSQDENTQIAIGDLQLMFSNLEKLNIEKDEIKLILIEFSYEDDEAYIGLFGKYENEWFENELSDFSSKFQLTKTWKTLESNKFSTISELLEIIEFDEEEYPQIFLQVCNLRAYESLRLALLSDSIAIKLKNEFKNLKIQVGHHDEDFHTIYNN